MKNIMRGFSLVICMALCAFSAFFCFNNTKCSNNNDSNVYEAQTPISEEILNTESTLTYKTWGAEKMGVPDYAQYLLDIEESNNGSNKLEEMVVAILDTGIDTDHPWFVDRLLYDNNGKIIGLDYTADQTDVNLNNEYKFEDDNGHGTHCAGIICDMTLPNVKILPVKIMYGSEGDGNSEDAVNAIKKLIEMKNDGLNIVAMNMSFGGTITLPNHQLVLNKCKKAIEDAYDAGIFSVVAAGNANKDACSDLPAMIERAITVSAIDSNLIKADFSNFGECIDVCAPGVLIESAYHEEEFKELSGTSMAAPHIVSFIALLKSDPLLKYSMTDIEAILSGNYNGLNTVQDLGEAGKDDIFGYGLPILNNLIQHATYTVNYYLEPIYDLQLNQTPDFSNYTLFKSITDYGVLGSRTKAAVENINGFTVIDFEQTIINEDTEVNIYYKRNKYTITIQTTENGFQNISGSGEYLYGATVELIPILDEEFVWNFWEIIECDSIDFYKNFQEDTEVQEFIMPDSNLKLKAYAAVTIRDIKDIDWPDITLWGSGFIAIVVILMLISRPRIKKR